MVPPAVSALALHTPNPGMSSPQISVDPTNSPFGMDFVKVYADFT
jgi:hypothetical protein